MRVEETDTQDTFKVSGRGELHLTILIETMRREGYEFCISRPEVLIKEINGKPHEPEEFVIVDIEETYLAMLWRSWEKEKPLCKTWPKKKEIAGLSLSYPRVDYLGSGFEFLTLTKGTGVLNRIFHKFIPHCGEIAQRINGVLIALENGSTTGFSLFNLQERGTFFGDQEKKYIQG
ncbi:MAG: hypothetical protein Ct9H300mP23_05060 [Nitrospinota bacterium]|nr:MAG: hypothetical protein Ct9H300mP23_05060 [Nitrospinota bacterium]